MPGYRERSGTPSFFRAPAGLRNPFLDPILIRTCGVAARWGWTRRGFDTVSADCECGFFRRLATPLQGGDILLLHDGHAARTRERHRER